MGKGGRNNGAFEPKFDALAREASGVLLAGGIPDGEAFGGENVLGEGKRVSGGRQGVDGFQRAFANEGEVEVGNCGAQNEGGRNWD